MASQPLGKVADAEAAASAEGAHVAVTIRVARAWVARGEAIEVEVEAPELARCARCEGGGCDGCGRSGAVRLASEVAERTFTLALPAGLAERTLVRVPRPFGEEGPIGLAVCEVQLAEGAERCRLRAPLTPASPPALPLAPLAWLAPLAAVAAAIAWALFGR